MFYEFYKISYLQNTTQQIYQPRPTRAADRRGLGARGPGQGRPLALTTASTQPQRATRAASAWLTPGRQRRTVGRREG
jgi:hypothetical protein